MKPLVSIIIPVYNTGLTAIPLVESLLDSDYKQIEIILVDDGSKDDSLEVLKAIESKKVRVFSKTNGGPSSARNYGLKEAKGEYVCFIDSDDSVAPNFISRLVEEVIKPETALVATAVHYKKLSKEAEEDVYMNEFTRRNAESIRAFTLRSLLADGRMYPVFNKIFKREVIEKNKLRFDETWDFAEDLRFVLDYIGHSEGEIRFILEPLYIYNYGTATSTVGKSGAILANWEKGFAYLKEWMGKNLTTHEEVMLFLLHQKWRVSWFRSR